MSTTPITPITPLSDVSSSKTTPLPQTPPPTPKEPHTSINEPYSLQHSMQKNGYIPIKEISSTLQGSIWKAFTKDIVPCVIKITSINLHNQRITLINGKKIPISEDIIKEASILQYLTVHHAPHTITHFIDFYVDDSNYFLVEEDGGDPLFDFVKNAHELIVLGKLSIKEYQRFCKLAMKQIVEAVEWLHNKMHIAHLDISLENFTINNVFVVDDKQISFVDGFQIKLIDFGLSEAFDNIDKNGIISFKCNKFVGKTIYKAPKVYGKTETFNAELADIWSIGILLFCMSTGTILYKTPSPKDIYFRYVISGHLLEILESRNRTSYVNKDCFDLMLRIFRNEKHRINTIDVKNHKWFKM